MCVPAPGAPILTEGLYALTVPSYAYNRVERTEARAKVVAGGPVDAAVKRPLGISACFNASVSGGLL